MRQAPRHLRPARKLDNKQHDARRREAKPWRKWYSLEIWGRIRARVLAEQPLCVLCARRGRTVAASVVDHHPPHKGDWDKFIAGPFRSLCKPCHDSPAQAAERGRQRVMVGADGWPVP